MADKVTAKGSDAKFTPHEPGQALAKCVDIISLGEVVQDFPGSDKYLAEKCALVFLTENKNPDTGAHCEISQEFTVSMGEKANLRKFLESWRGKPYKEDAIKEGVPLDKLEGNYGLINVAHRVSGKGKTYAFIQSIVPVPRQMMQDLPDFGDYTRAKFWAERKKEYADAAKAYRQSINAPVANGDNFDDFPGGQPQDEDDDLPF